MNAAASPYILTLENPSVLAALPPPPLEAAGSPDAALPEFLDRLRLPVSADTPCGPHLLLEGTHQAIRDARQADNPRLSQGIWQRDLKVADWFRVRDLSRSALLDRSRDLLLALWLTEAWGHLHGFSGIAAGIRVCLTLQQTFGAALHPCRHDPDDDHPMQAAVEWANRNLTDLVQHLPLLPCAGSSGDIGALCFLDHEAARTRKARPGEVTSFLTADQARAVLEAAPSDLLLARLVTAGQAADAVADWAAAIPDLMTGYEASLGSLRTTLDQIVKLLRQECDRRGLNPDGLDDLMQPEDDLPAAAVTTETPAAAPAGEARAVGGLTGPVTTREEAYRALEQIADFLMRQEPHSPVPYMLRRAHRWGQMPLSDLLTELSRQGIGLVELSGLLDLNGDR